METAQKIEKTAQEEMLDRVAAVTERLVTIEAMLNAYKSLFSEKDKLTAELLSLVGLETEVDVGDSILYVKDNFKETNVVFKPAAVRRYDLVVDSVSVRAEKALKKARKGE